MCPVARYIGIYYFGAQTPRKSLNALRIYKAVGNTSPLEVTPSSSPRFEFSELMGRVDLDCGFE